MRAETAVQYRLSEHSGAGATPAAHADFDPHMQRGVTQAKIISALGNVCIVKSTIGQMANIPLPPILTVVFI